MAFILSKRWCVYTDWTQEDTPRPFYVGKGNARRVNGKVFRNQIHQRIGKKYGQQRRVEFETDDEAEALAREVQLIAELKTYTHGGKGYWGANLTQGGDGTSGRIWTDRQREAARQRRLGSKMPTSFCRKHSADMKALWKDPTYREHVLIARQGSYSVSSAHKEHLALCATKRWADPKFRERMSKIPRRCRRCKKTGHYASTCTTT
jgi:hypothetical protein